MAFPAKKSKEFRPTPAMMAYAFEMAKTPEHSQASAARAIGSNPATPSKWKAQHGDRFEKWLEEKISQYRIPILKRLEQIALENAHDYRFWDRMCEKYGFTKPTESEGHKLEIDITGGCVHVAKEHDKESRD